MAINIVKFREKEAYGVYEFICDFDSDVKDLKTDCAPGSKAYVVESGKNYIFNSLKKWEVIKGSSDSSENINNYENLENKPQINGNILSGNKTSDDLDLQSKLTAGTNITIANDGTISASGGVTSYDDLNDKPAINGRQLTKDSTADSLYLMSAKTISAMTKNEIHISYPFYFNKNLYLHRDIYINEDNYNNRYILGIQDNFFRDYSGFMNQLYGGDYDFSLISSEYSFCGCLYFMQNKLRNSPAFINNLANDIKIIQIFTPKDVAGNSTTMIRYIIGADITSSVLKTFYQTATATLQQNGSYSITNQSSWVEFGSSGSQIVSGVVNQNGTITFTNSDGTTFTTTGESVIGPQGNPGSSWTPTEEDLNNIAQRVLNYLPSAENVEYGY